MRKDIFKWKMSAEMHKTSIYALRNEIREHHADQKEMDIGLLLDLLPLETNDSDIVLARGNISFNGNSFENIGEESWIEFFDQVIGKYYATIKENWNGAIIFKDEVIEITFETPIELEIPQLNELGVDRSSFQLLTRITSSKDTTISVLVDADSELKETWIDAVLDNNSYNENDDFKEDLENYSLFDTSSNSCGKDPNEPNWYVYRRTDGICIVHYGEFVTGGSVYVRQYGPDKKKNCDAWADQNCI